MPTWFKFSKMEIEEVLKALKTSENGLTGADVKARLERYGYNEVKFKRENPVFRFLKQFKSLLIYILLVVSVFTILIGEWVDAVVIIGVVFINSLIGFIQEGKATKAMESLQKLVKTETKVIRDDKSLSIPSSLLVPGDIVKLEMGDKVPADIRVIRAKNLFVDESALTGESVPVEKVPVKLSESDINKGEFKNTLFSGTLLTEGAGTGVVVSTGSETEIGKISRVVQREGVKTPLIKKIDDFSRSIALAIIAVAAFNFIIALLFGYEIIFSFLASTSLAVAAIPEGLPAIITITLALGVADMARRNAIVRNLPSVETLGSVTVICSDKTGTLTKNEMTVKCIYAGGGFYEVDGVGYETDGKIRYNGSELEDLPEPLRLTLECGINCNNASLTDGELQGDPTEKALIISAYKGGVLEKADKIDEIPFDSQKKYMAVLTKDNLIYVKGAPEKIIEMCSYELRDDLMEINPQQLRKKLNQLASKGLRVLAFAFKEHSRETVDDNDLKEMVFLGFQGMIDPPRPEAIDAIKKCKSAGIRTIMITGDHAKTAEAIAANLGIPVDKSLTGAEISSMDDDELRRAARRYNVYARVPPEGKYRITRALQSLGNIVAVTGDGVNDAPALKMADVGVAMGGGTDVAKEAADIILTDDNFATIVTAVSAGREIYEKIQKIIYYVLPTSGGQALIILSSFFMSFLGVFRVLPLLPLQILWINLFDGIFLAMPLINEPLDSDMLKKPPRDPKEKIVNEIFIKKVGIVSMAMAFSGLSVFYIASRALTVPQARTVTFATVIMVHVFYLLTARSTERSVFKMDPLSNKWIIYGVSVTIFIMILIIYVPHLEFVFNTSPFPLQWWAVVIPFSLTGITLIEIEKLIGRR
ncbi:MAG: HAD-IC family P-type ATPase [Methanothermobacter sp.]|nr:HAD-IC family P-type ATPase [Methanothermobacter sp.]